MATQAVHSGTTVTDTERMVERAMRKHLIPAGAQCSGEFATDSTENGNHIQVNTRCNGSVVVVNCTDCDGQNHCVECAAECKKIAAEMAGA